MRPRALLLLAVLLLAGCATKEDGGATPSTAPTQGTPATTPGPDGARADLTLVFVRSLLNATPGHVASFPVTLAQREGAPRLVDVSLRGEGVEGALRRVEVRTDRHVTVFLPVEVAAGAAPGERALLATVVDAQGRELLRREGAARLSVLAPGQGYEPGDVATVLYAGRLASTNETFNTNDPSLQGLPFAQTADYSYSAVTMRVRSHPQPSVVPGFHEAVLGMVPGESRTVTFPAEKGYGNATVEERVPRETALPRQESLELPVARLSASDFADYLNETEQGRPEDYDVGDLVVNRNGGDTLRYRIVNKTQDEVLLRLHAEVSERFSIYQFWPNASVVLSVNETHATFRTTPAGDGPVTYHHYWPEMTSVARMDESTITLRHDPPVGLRFARSSNPYQRPEESTVLSLDEREIVVSTPSSHALAGKALTFDIFLVDLARGANPST